MPGTTLQNYFQLNHRRAEAAKKYLGLFRDNDMDAILMPPAPHTAVPLDCWTKAAYTSLWSYLDYPAVVIPVDEVRDSDAADDLANAEFGPDDEELYRLCKDHLFPFPYLKLTCDSSRHGPGTVQGHASLRPGCRI